MKCCIKSISGDNVVVLNSNLQFIYKDSAYLKTASPISETWAPHNQRALSAHVSHWEEHNLG